MAKDEAGSDDAVFEQLSRLRRSLVERMWRAFFCLSVLVLPILLWRAQQIQQFSQSGSPLTNTMFIVLACLMLVLYPLRHRIPFGLRAAMPIIVLSLVGVVSLPVFGAASIAFGWLVQSNFLLSTLYSLRAGILATLASALFALCIAVLHLSGILGGTIDLNLYFAQPTSWLLFLLGTTVVPTIILYSIGGYQRTIGELLTTVQAKRDKLGEMSVRLGEALAAQERANAAKSSFLAHMTHELRTPVSGVIGMLDIADRRNADPALARLLGIARQNAESLLKIINDVLDYSKLDAEKITLNPEAFDLSEFLKTSLQVFEWRAHEKGLDFVCEIDERLTRMRYADPARIRQVLYNLISNALKFTDAGSVRLNVRAAVFDGADDTRVLFEVSDTGVGIAPADLERLFGEFVQVGDDAQRHRGGTGLGLAISRLLVQAMGGDIRVRSTAGVGSVFSMELPLPAAPHPMPSTSGAEGALSQPDGPADAVQLNILLAEDSPTNQLVVSTHLQDLGHRVVVADNGQLAIECASRENFDLILMDLRMPVLAGMEAAAMIRQGGTEAATIHDRDVFICALTANASCAERANALSVGMNDFLTKPARTEALKALLDRVVAHQRERGIPMSPRWREPRPESPAHAMQPGAPPQRVTSTSPAAGADAPRSQAHLQELFQADLLRQLSQLVQGVADARWDQVREVAHRVKGSAQIMGVHQLAQAASLLETACQTAYSPQRMERVRALVRGMEDYLEHRT